eukprot:COSAG04_NODE_11504_length_705_cov_1.186469_1_plen_69_part_00
MCRLPVAFGANLGPGVQELGRRSHGAGVAFRRQELGLRHGPVAVRIVLRHPLRSATALRPLGAPRPSP